LQPQHFATKPLDKFILGFEYHQVANLPFTPSRQKKKKRKKKKVRKASNVEF
jgi:hypothetical protein